MFRVMIVEDELLVCIGLKNMIDWAGMGMEVIAEAQNGRAALELYGSKKPDLILTDIKMPEMDGLELISRIREKDKATKIIILTCVKEFDLVRQALKLGVSDYILKLQMSMEEMETVIRKVRNELESGADRLPERDSSLDVGLMKENLISRYLLYHSCSDSEFAAGVKQLGARISPAGLILCVMKLDKTRFAKADEKHEVNVSKTIVGLIGELLDKYKRGEIVYVQEEQYILLLSFEDIPSEQESRATLDDILLRINEAMKNYINTSVTFGVSSKRNRFADLGEMYREACSATELSFVVGEGRPIRYGDDDNACAYSGTVIRFRTFIQNASLNEPFKKEILAAIGRLEKMFKSPVTEIQELFSWLFHWPALNTNEFRSDTFALSTGYANRMRACATINDTIELFERYLLEIARCQTNRRLVNRELTEAITFIRANYARDFSLQQLADRVGMSGNYLSSLFKKELQVSFVDYLNAVRIDKAKELLLTTHMRSYEIAQTVGFTDESYFSRIFKRITGFRPSEYKKTTFDGKVGLLP
jgi:Response regulator containing CheY-like receiver domain and AraC-type DNA-binding domain